MFYDGHKYIVGNTLTTLVNNRSGRAGYPNIGKSGNRIDKDKSVLGFSSTQRERKQCIRLSHIVQYKH